MLVRHGGTYVRVHTCRLQHAPLEASPCEMLEGNSAESTSQTEQSQVESEDDDNSSELIASRQPSSLDNADGFVTPTRTDRNKPIIGKRIEFWTKDGERHVAKVVSRAGKAGGLYGACYNIQRDTGEIDWIDLARQVEKWRPVQEQQEILIAAECSPTILAAKELELASWKKNQVFVEVPDEGQDYISVRWVVTEKMKDDVPVIKARLVARGYEEDLQEQRTDSPTCSKESLRLVMSLISAFKWKCNSVDIKTAYLQGDPISRDIYLKPPVEFCNGTLWKLKKTVYGLCDAARAWYFRVRKVLLSLGMQMSSLDQALFYWCLNGELAGIICIHVDDFFWAGSEYFSVRVMKEVENQFFVGSTSCGSFKYIGINVSQNSSGVVSVDQNDYVSHLKEISLNPCYRRKTDVIDDKDKSNFRSLVGQLNWVATQTRPEVSFDVCQLTSVFDTATVEDVQRANKVVKMLKREKVAIRFPSSPALQDWSIECYCDASFGNLQNGGSQGGFVIFLTDDLGNKCPLLWQSKRIRRVVKSTFAAETLALVDAAEASIYLARMLSEVAAIQSESIAVRCFVDNRSLVDALYSTKSVEDKYLRINIAVLRDMIAKHDLHSVSWVKTSHQLANVLTKKGASPAQLLAAVSSCTHSESY